MINHISLKRIWRPLLASLLGMALCAALLTGCRSSESGSVGENAASSDAFSQWDAASVQAKSQPGKGNFTGVWQRTNIAKSQSATITISEETKSNFVFTVNSRNGANIGATEGVAHLLTATEATCTYNTGGGTTVTFRLEDKTLHVAVSNNDALGFGNGVTMAGSYVTGTPEYTDEDWQNQIFADSASASYADLLDGEASLYLTDVMEEGALVNQYEVFEPSGEMYRFFVHGAGMGADILKTDDNRLFIGLMGYEDDYVLYTNHPGYQNEPPKEYQEIAAGTIRIVYAGQ